MLKISRVVIISILIVTQWSVWAQNNTNSPYTRFGFGELADRSFAAGRGMGGIGYGLRSPKQINPMNPASYSCMDSMTFIFEFGAAAQLSWYNDGVNNQKNVNGNIEYLAMQFPLSRRIAMSIGILPYSYVGYEFGETNTIGGAVSYQESYLGTGGLNEVYGGLSIDIWKKRLSMGANIGYLFGNVNHERNVVFLNNSGADDIVNQQKIEVRDLKMDFGLQYTHPLGLRERITLGAVYSPARELNAKSYSIRQVGSSSTGGYLESDTITGQRFDLPDSYGLGLTYVKDNKLTVGADVLYEEWGKAYFFDNNNYYDNRLRLAAGAEYIPNAASRKFFPRVKYRAGIHYSNSYLQMNIEEGGATKQYGYDEYGLSVGLGLPIRTGFSADENRSYINLSFEYVKVKPELRTMIDEQYFRFTVNFTFNEQWFMKRKIQ